MRCMKSRNWRRPHRMSTTDWADFGNWLSIQPKRRTSGGNERDAPREYRPKSVRRSMLRHGEYVRAFRRVDGRWPRAGKERALQLRRNRTGDASNGQARISQTVRGVCGTPLVERLVICARPGSSAVAQSDVKTGRISGAGVWQPANSHGWDMVSASKLRDELKSSSGRVAEEKLAPCKPSLTSYCRWTISGVDKGKTDGLSSTRHRPSESNR